MKRVNGRPRSGRIPQASLALCGLSLSAFIATTAAGQTSIYPTQELIPDPPISSEL